MGFFVRRLAPHPDDPLRSVPAVRHSGLHDEHCAGETNGAGRRGGGVLAAPRQPGLLPEPDRRAGGRQPGAANSGGAGQTGVDALRPPDGRERSRCLPHHPREGPPGSLPGNLARPGARFCRPAAVGRRQPRPASTTRRAGAALEAALVPVPGGGGGGPSQPGQPPKPVQPHPGRHTTPGGDPDVDRGHEARRGRVIHSLDRGRRGQCPADHRDHPGEQSVGRDSPHPGRLAHPARPRGPPALGAPVGHPVRRGPDPCRAGHATGSYDPTPTCGVRAGRLGRGHLLDGGPAGRGAALRRGLAAVGRPSGRL